MLSSLAGRNVLVTGAGSGIGRAIAERFLDAGAVVGCNVLPGDERGARAVRALAEHGRAHLVIADATDAHQVVQAVTGLVAEIGTIDVLVSNAGIAQIEPFVDLDLADWDRMLAVHLGGAVNTTSACLPAMLKQRFGRILFTSSELASVGHQGLTHYCAAKGALESFCRALAREVGEYGVTVNCVAPGPTATGLVDAEIDEQTDENRERIPLRSFGDPDNVAWSWLFLASEGGRWYTGQVLSPNGGLVM